MTAIHIRPMQQTDLISASAVYKATFSRQTRHLEWLTCNFNAAPRLMCFVAEQGNDILGYIIWTQKSGFRPEAVLELEQLAVMPSQQGKGIGRALITDSLPQLKSQLANAGASIKHILVTTRSDNHAQKLYQQTLGAEIETTISELYSADEVLMIARNIQIS